MAILLAYLVTALILALSFGIIPMSVIYSVAIVATGIATVYTLIGNVMALAR